MNAIQKLTAFKWRNFRFVRWQWEVSKMFVYVFFPITMFYYFSNPAVYEGAIADQYALFNLPPDEKDVQAIQNVKDEIRKKKIEEMRSKIQQDLKK